MKDYPTTALKVALNHLRESTILSTVVDRLGRDAATINVELGKTVVAEIPAFSDSGNPDILPELAQHAAEHTDEMQRLLLGGSVGNFEFVRSHAKRRAEQHFPLEATLHAYRCGHKVYSRWVRDAILSVAAKAKDPTILVAACADFALEYTDAVSTVCTSAYVSQTRLIAAVAVDHRADLLNILLEGYDESDGRVAEILRDAGYLDGRQSFCIVQAQSVDPAEMLNPARARRLADSINGLLPNSTVRRVIDVRGNKVTGVFSDTRRTSGWTAPNVGLAKRIAAESSMLGNAILIGVSNDVPSTSRIPNAYREAQLALSLADVTNRVVQFSEVPVRRLLLHMAGEEFQRALPTWADEFTRADRKSGGVLIATLQAYASANMNVLKAAESLSVHPNTIYARMQRILDVTDLDARTFHGLSELLIVAECGNRTTVRAAEY